MAAYVLFDLVYRVARELGVAFEGTATAGAAGQLTDNIYLKDRFGDNYFNAGTLMMLYDAGGAGVSPQGEWARITDFAENPGIIYHENFLTPEGIEDRYAAISPEFTLDTLIQNINMALNSIEIPYVDTSLTTDADKTEYTLPTDILNQNLKVYLQRVDTSGDYRWIQVSLSVKLLNGVYSKFSVIGREDITSPLQVTFCVTAPPPEFAICSPLY